MKVSDRLANLLTEYGVCRRRLIKYGTCVKNPQKAVNTLEAEKFNDLVKDATFDLDYISTGGVLVIKRHPRSAVREKLLKMVREAFETETEPITKKQMGGKGITVPMLLDMIELIETGKVKPKPKYLTVQITTENVETFKYMVRGGIKLCESYAKKEMIPKIERMGKTLGVA